MQTSVRARLAVIAVSLGGAALGQPTGVAEPAGAVGAEERSSAKADSVRIEGTTATLELVRTPAGSVVLRGQEHTVPPLCVGVTEVTWDLYDVYLYGLDEPEGGDGGDGVSRPSKPYVPPDRGFGHNGFAAIGMTRHGAERFCHWLSVKTGDRYRLPTEAEWVYLASAGEAGLQGEAATEETAWVEENADWTPQKVGTMPANAFGLRDTLGNVAEWVTSEGKTPVAMGGSYLDPASACTPEHRQEQTSMWNSSDPQIPKSRWWLADCGFVGFRVVRECPPAGSDGTGEPTGTE